MSDPIAITDSRHIDSSPGSNASGSDSDFLPTNLASEELKLALNKEASEEELLKALSRCKSLILECDQFSNERKWVVRHLIELRLRLQECRDAMSDPLHPRNQTNKVCKRIIKGHHLNLQPLLRQTVSKYCDHCTGTIWSMIQAWYECEDCEYSCHHKCLASVVRECAHVIASEKGSYDFEICPELGMSAQKYLCAECKSPLSINKVWGEARRCDYTGLYYCTACHWASSAVIPARVIHNWDFDPQPVCQASLQLLKITAKKPIININKLNPKLFSLVSKLDFVRRLRIELIGMKKYLTVCRKANEQHIIWKNVDTPYLLENADMYSLQDLVEINAGDLPFKLQFLLDIFSNHIKIECEICKGRAHICEICSNDEVLYPFEVTSHVCSKCCSVLHKFCFSKKNECPKCVRLKKREQEKGEELNED